MGKVVLEGSEKAYRVILECVYFKTLTLALPHTYLHVDLQTLTPELAYPQGSPRARAVEVVLPRLSSMNAYVRGAGMFTSHRKSLCARSVDLQREYYFNLPHKLFHCRPTILEDGGDIWL